jgi:hypothetical protein
MQDKDNRKTLTFLLVAAMALLVAWEPWRPSPMANDAPADVGQKLFPDFKDPLSAKSLEIVSFDEDTAALSDFKVAQVGGVWSIPSHSDYPADAADHMAQAANALLDVEILNLASTKPGDQELYGVITPDPAKLRPGMVGVGTRITVKDGKDQVLADLVIGKEVKDQPALRYVRRADRDQIFTVNVKTDKFSTKFENWIEKNLLKLNAFDVREVGLNDYSLTESLTNQGVRLLIHKRSRMKLGYDDAKSSWSLLDMAEFDPKGEPVPAKLEDDEELNSEKLNTLKTALNDLQIVDVQRKPKGLSQDLRASEELVKDNEAQMSLVERGFYPVGENNEIYSSEGEVTCTTKDGVRYVLRFGRLAGGEEAKSEKKPDEKEKSSPALNRYLFVMAQFDESQIARPELEAVPGEDQPADATKPAEEQPAEEKAADEKGTDEKPAEKKGTDKKATGEKVPQKKTADDETKVEPPAAKTDAAAEEKPDAKPATPDEEKRIAVQKENKRKQDSYDSAIKKGEDRVKELNERFADWYYVISDDVYKKIHLGRKEIVKKKETKEATEPKPGGLGDLKEFEKGLKPDSDEPQK